MLRSNRLRYTLISIAVPRLFLLLTLSAYSLSLVSYLRFLYAGKSRAGSDRLPPTQAHGVVFALHVTLSILAYAAFALSFVLSAIFLLENRLLRNRHLGDVVWRLPALDLLERMSQSSVLIGLVSIAVGGLNHRTAPLEVRERVSFTLEQARRAADELRSRGLLEESLVLSTCNRSEL